MLELIKKLAWDKRIVILGFGLEGQSSLRFLLSSKLIHHIVVIDQNSEIDKHPLIKENKIPSFGGADYLQYLLKDDFVIKSPGVKLEGNFASYKTYSQTSLFLEKYQKQIIGITGTKGKSTTSTMIYQILKKQNKDAFLVGNIGQPAFDLVEKIKPETWIVYELSAHQLQCVSHGPAYAILLNLMPEHLDFFKDKKSYYKAKLHIFKHQLKGSFSYISSSCKNDVISLMPVVESDEKTKVKQAQIFLNGKVVLQSSDLKYLLGTHHIQNIHAVLELVIFLNLDFNIAIESIIHFHPLPHRQEFLGEKHGIRFVNDSISTIPQSAIQAVQAIGKVDYLILGGLDRGVAYNSLVDFLGKTNFTKVFFLGKAGARIVQELKDKFELIPFEITIAEKLQDLKNELLEIKKGTVLLSPAAASYDAFKNFEERGDYFRKIFAEI